MNHRVLIVDSHPLQLGVSRRALADAGYDVTVVSTFEEAKRRLASGQPLSLLVAAVRLGPYNGLHLALRARAVHPQVAIIITDQTFDIALEREARNIGAVYVAHPSPAQLASLAGDLLSGTTRVPASIRRWVRINLLEALPAAIGPVAGQLVDMSYGGVRLRFPSGELSDTLPSTMELVLPDKGVAVTIHPVWARSAEHAEGWLCGGELVDSDAQSLQEWRRFVDTYASPA
jgi:CheY-like chemotaxis protein